MPALSLYLFSLKCLGNFFHRGEISFWHYTLQFPIKMWLAEPKITCSNTIKISTFLKCENIVLLQAFRNDTSLSRFFAVIYLFSFDKSSCHRSEISCAVVKLVWKLAYNKGTENCKLFKQLWNNFVILLHYKLLSCSKSSEALCVDTHVCMHLCVRVVSIRNFHGSGFF